MSESGRPLNGTDRYAETLIPYYDSMFNVMALIGNTPKLTQLRIYDAAAEHKARMLAAYHPCAPGRLPSVSAFANVMPSRRNSTPSRSSRSSPHARCRPRSSVHTVFWKQGENTRWVRALHCCFYRNNHAFQTEVGQEKEDTSMRLVHL